MNGFHVRYQGPKSRQSNSSNILLKIGSNVEMWNKLMKEVKLNRVVGPFKQIPFANYIQSPIGMVPKDDGKKTHLIFHLSFDFDGENEELKSLNYHTPKDLCSVRYNDIDCAVSAFLSLAKKSEQDMEEIGKLRDNGYTAVRSSDENAFFPIFSGKTDVQSAFRLVPLLKESWQWLVMKAKDPETGKWRFFH